MRYEKNEGDSTPTADRSKTFASVSLEVDLLLQEAKKRNGALGKASVVRRSGETSRRRPTELAVVLYIHVMGLLILRLFSRNIVSKVLSDFIRPRLREFSGFHTDFLHRSVLIQNQ